MIVDLFAGAGGWDVAARNLGLEPLGFEMNAAACKTRSAAGMPTVRCDIATLPLAPLAGRVTGLIASPPCQSFSRAGKRQGLADTRGQLVWEPLRWAETLRPDWVALEQVPDVLPIWRHTARQLHDLGYSTWCGILDAADYGVPQNRTRAILIARRHGPAVPPEPTHSEHGTDAGMFGGGTLPWVTMADALGWDGTLSYVRGAGFIERHGPRDGRSTDRPAPTITCAGAGAGGSQKFVLQWKLQPGSWADGRGGNRRLLAELAALQGFPADHPWQGSKSAQALQIGNAIPPPLAQAILTAATGLQGTLFKVDIICRVTS